jgi:hypothetical protein
MICSSPTDVDEAILVCNGILEHVDVFLGCLDGPMWRSESQVNEQRLKHVAHTFSQTSRLVNACNCTRSKTVNNVKIK